MLTRILDWSLRHRLLVVLAWLGVVVAGVLSAIRLPIDAFPDTTPVQVQINAVAPALGPLEIERQITRPVEWAISGLPKLNEVRSVSKFGFSQVTVTFDDDADVYAARQWVGERIQTVELPVGRRRASAARPDIDGSRGGVPLPRDRRGQDACRAAHVAELGDQAPAPKRYRRGRGQYLGR
jgi:Cu/Ag efflux pump CusA